jgi:hypothetical protein
MSSGEPLTLTTNPRLDAALMQGLDRWLATSREVGVTGTVRWLAQRSDLGEHRETVQEILEALHAVEMPDEAVTLYAELGDMLIGEDDVMADALYEAVLAHGIATSDAEAIEDAVVHLAEIAEALTEPLTAAEYYIDFLNWRREDEHASDPESVLNAFDEVIRIATEDGAQQAAALFQFRQAQFSRLVEAGDERATTGDWEIAPDPYVIWS